MRSPHACTSAPSRSLAKRGCCVFAFDARGHGDSTSAAAADGYTPESFAADLQSLIVELVRRTSPVEAGGVLLRAPAEQGGDSQLPAARRMLRPAPCCWGSGIAARATTFLRFQGGARRPLTVSHIPPRHGLSYAQELYTAPLILCGFGAGASAALVAASQRPALFAGVILCELWSPSEAPRDAASFHYGQAAEFESPRQAAAFLSASCWVRVVVSGCAFLPPHFLATTANHRRWQIQKTNVYAQSIMGHEGIISGLWRRDTVRDHFQRS